MEGKQKFVTSSRDAQPAASTETVHIKKLLKEQRKSIIDSLKTNLPAYLNYKFSTVASAEQLNQIRRALIEFDQSEITDNLCEATRRNGLHGFNVFYHEVNQIISNMLQLPGQE